MRKLAVFNHMSLDGYFVDRRSDMSWAHENGDAEWHRYTSENTQGGAELVFGRVTYEMMAGFWSRPEAAKQLPDVAEAMNRLSKVVCSRTLERATWNNTTLIKSDIVSALRARKDMPGPDMLIMGSGTIVRQLTEARLIDAYQIIVNPLVLGGGRTMFEGLESRLKLKLVSTRAFGNGNVVHSYVP